MSTNSSAESKRASTTMLVVVLLICASTIAALILMTIPHLVHAPGHSQTRSVSQIQQIGVATEIYRTDWNDTFMPVQDQSSFRESLAPYINSWQLFDPRVGDILFDPTFNTNLSAVSETSIDDHSQVISVFTLNGPPPDAHLEGYTVAFVDTSVKSIPAKDWPTKRQSLDWILPRVSEDLLPPS